MGNYEKATAIYHTIKSQKEQSGLARHVRIDCQCGKSISIVAMYRCHHCGIWFCRYCGNNHFNEDKTGLVGQLTGNN